MEAFSTIVVLGFEVSGAMGLRNQVSVLVNIYRLEMGMTSS